MQKIRPVLTETESICAEIKAPPNGFVVFGASGDLAKRKLFASLFALFDRNLISEQFYLLGGGRKKLSDKTFRQTVLESVKDNLNNDSIEKLKQLIKRFYYICGDYGDTLFYKNMKEKLYELDKKYKVENNHIFYLAVPPLLYTTIVEQLGSLGLSCTERPDVKHKTRLVVEKPFGFDLKSALELNNNIQKCFDESQIYRIDHYLGKETVQNILIFRFANAIFEPIWNRNYIDNVQITIAESIGVEHRGSYYDKTGALRDMFQNHMLQMLALATMEPPTSFKAEHIRDEKVKLLQSIRPFSLQPWSENIIRGQYGPGTINGRKVSGYRQEPGVESDSKTETFIAAKLFIENWRWKDIPFYLRTGKRLAKKQTEISITFKKAPHSMFASAGLNDMLPNVLSLQIQPDEGISLSFQAKRPGSKICITTLNMNFNYHDVFGIQMPEAYQRLLLDCMLGDQTLFTRQDDVKLTWQLLTPIMQKWQSVDSVPHEYPAGAESFPAADNLIESDGRRWRKLQLI